MSFEQDELAFDVDEYMFDIKLQEVYDLLYKDIVRYGRNISLNVIDAFNTLDKLVECPYEYKTLCRYKIVMNIANSLFKHYDPSVIFCKEGFSWIYDNKYKLSLKVEYVDSRHVKIFYNDNSAKHTYTQAVNFLNGLK